MFGVPAFEPVRRFLECALFERDAYDHFAAAVPWRHRIQNLRASVEHADAGRPAHLMSGKRKEIAAELLHIERHVPDALRSVHEREYACCARFRTKLRDRINRAERI